MNLLIRPLKYINSLPFPVTVRHYASFGHIGRRLKDGELRSKESWQTLRDEHPRYRIPQDRETWIHELSLNKDGQDDKLQERINAFVALIEKEGIRTVYSIGAGGGVFEYYLKKRLPYIKIVASELTQMGVDRLRRVFIECDTVERFDALNAEHWKKIGSDPEGVVFIYRNEREFSDEDWRKMFRYMDEAGVQKVFLGIMYMLTVSAFVQEKIRNLKRRFRGESVTFVGYLRSHEAFRTFWEDRYNEREISFPNCRGLYLTRT
ncbi:MAG: hypothetical protein Q8P86_01560 [bacterium]|nr:hypothetical protein [bacterium]